MSTILCCATEWFSKKGGLSTFNRNLCVYLAKQHKVYCYLPTFDEEEKLHAQRFGVILIKPRISPGVPSEICIYNKPKLPANDTIDILIGHDRITGPNMALLHNEFFPNTKSILFIHMNPSEIEWYKPEKLDSDPAGIGEDREKLQKELAKSSSLIVTVGPKLFTDANRYMAGFDHPPIVRFDPGLFEDPGKINYDFSWPNPEALVMGRLEDSYLKGVDIALKAMTAVFGKWPTMLAGSMGKPNLILRGCVPGKAKKFREDLDSLVSGLKTDYEIRNYTPEPDILVEDIRRTAVTLLPSRTEGFGLVALEAISLGRPILVGEDTGFAALLRETIPTEASDWIAPTTGHNEGIDQWADKIQAIFLDRKAAGVRLKRLVDAYNSRITWDLSVTTLMEIVEKQPKIVYFLLSTALQTDVNCYGLPLWDNSLEKHVGDAAEADYKVSGDEIKITRKNAVGRNLIDILKYRPKNGELNFIEHLAPSTKDRAISISFEAKVTGDPINLFVILHKYRNHSWYRYGWVQIAGSDWQRFHMVRKVDANTDLTVQIQEKDFQGNNTQYEIRNYAVEEWAGGLAADARDLVLLNGFRVERLIGYRPRDISENIELSERSTFHVKIDLNKSDQIFIIYLAVITSEGQQIWLGFSGGLGTAPGKDKTEYTVHSRFPDKTVVFQENVFAAFNRGFPELKGHPVKAYNVRLRASNVDQTEITFSYSIEA